MNLKELKELIELVSEKGFAEFEIERQGFRLRISRFSHAPVAAVSAFSPPATPADRTIASAPVSGISAPPAAQSEAPESAAADSTQAAQAPGGEPSVPQQELYVLKSPIVGTFYRSPSPDAPPFVNTGSRVEKGQVLCIIEAMKLMNEIESDVEGVIAEVYPQNGQPVEYGEPLFGIKV
jgi:acetyl-CoA carboxylase biotin carboxyl carrier protein